MDYKIVNKQIFADRFKRLDIHCPPVARKAKAGQFVKICPAEGEVSIPLTVFEADPQRGIISLIVHEADPAAQRLGLMPINEPVYSVLGPLGVPTPVERKGVVVCIATGVGIGRVLPVARALKQLGNKVIGIIGARFAATDDGSHEHRGLATDVFRRLLGDQGKQGQPPVRGVYAAGSVEMMETVCELTRPLEIETYVVLDTAMVDCMGLCGACRVVVAGRNVQACVDGPTFDGHKVDFHDLKIRVNAFKEKDRWGNQQLASSPEGNESGILTKFPAGYPKS
jgi:ferredoxin/flavodoxin---NADP+ reductase